MILFYRLLLRLYPASFRIEYGDEMCAVFAQRCGEAGPFGVAGLVVVALVDVVPNALAAQCEVLRQDVHYTMRTLNRSRGFTVTVILVAALGIGANTAAFSLADYVLVRPLPFPSSDELVKIWERTPGYRRMELSAANYRDWKRMSTSFEAMGAFHPSAVNWAGNGEPQRLRSAVVSREVFSVLGVPPLFGQGFAAQEDGDGYRTSIVLSYGLWQTHFDAGSDVLGRAVNLDGIPYQVIGVMPPDFHFPNRDVQLWLPLSLREQDYVDRNDNDLEVVARLRDGVTVAEARKELEFIAARLEQEYPSENANVGANLLRLRDELSQRARLLLIALSGAALCILLLACANLANLLLARATSRRRELAVRAALGAGRDRLVRQMATESVALAVIGGVVGVAMGVLALPLLARLVPSSLPIAEQPGLDVRVLAVAAAFTALTGIGFGILPALWVSRRNGLSALRDGTRGGGGRKQRIRGLLVVVEIAASVVLLISSGLLVRAMWRLQETDPGFRAEGVLTMRTALPFPKYDAVDRRIQFYSRVLSDVRALPGVTNAAFASFLPIVRGGGIWPVVIEGQEVIREASNSASLRFVTPQYFATMGIPMVQGRDIEEPDDFNRPFVAVVSESFVRRYWPEEDPIGKHFEFGFADRVVAGVVGDVRVRGLERPSEPQVYLSYRQVADGSLLAYAPKDLVISSSFPTGSLLPAVRAVIGMADQEQPISDVRTLTDIVAGATASRRAQLRVLGVLAGVALVLAGVGIHGLLAFTVSQRSREIGVRMALGARRASIARMVFREGVLLAFAGIVPGVLVAYAAGRGMSTLLVGIDPGDPATILVAVGLCVTMALAGALLPTLRALRVSPISVIRAE